MNKNIINSPLYACLQKDVEALRNGLLALFYDPMAIMVKDDNDKKLGYIPRDKNEILSRLMDAGKLIYGTVYKKERIGKWLKITIRVFLSD